MLILPVYGLSVSSSIPTSLASHILVPSESLVRLRPLFSVGVHDIPVLETLADTMDNEVTPNVSQQRGWIACTSDEILATKSNLHDVVVELPTIHARHHENKRPTIRTSKGNSQIKATQRDLRRWKMLRRILDASKELASHNFSANNGDIHEEDAPLLPQFSTASLESEDDSDASDETQNLENTTWSELAYSSFLWWASAGEKDDFMVDEDHQDKAALADLVSLVEQKYDQRQYHDESENEDAGPTRDLFDSESKESGREDARVEMALVAYFQDLTRTLFEVTSGLLDEGEEDNGIDSNVANIGRDELRQLGLDAWSKNDRHFLSSFVELWYAREINVDRVGIECCGIKVC